MALNANQLTVKQSSLAADTIASAIWDLSNSLIVRTASDASRQRMLRRHAREVVELHDELDPKEIFAQHGGDSGDTFAQSNGHGSLQYASAES
jgi:hypothetical protein